MQVKEEARAKSEPRVRFEAYFSLKSRPPQFAKKEEASGSLVLSSS